MGPTLALPALLLLLLLPPPSLSQDKEATQKTVISTTVPTGTTTVSPIAPAMSSTAKTTVAVTLSTTQPTTASSPKEATVTGQSTTSPPGSTDSQSGDGSGSPTSPSGSQSDKTNTVRPPSDTDTTSSSRESVSSGGKSSDNITTAPPATQGSGQPTTSSSQASDSLATPKSHPESTTNSTASPHLSTPSQTTEDHSTFVFNSSGPPDDFESSGKPSVNTPLGTSKGTPLNTIQMPGTLPASTPWQTTGMGTETVPTAEEFTYSHLTPTAPQGPSTSSPVWTFRDYKLTCEAPMMPNKELLILNLTGASLCEGTPPDEKLVEMLCHSVKASFKPAQDQCTLQLAPILGSQAVAVKRVTIETKLPPKVVYELLKDKWDDLREAGVSDMMLGNEGPPETNEDRFSLPLIITIVCMASFLLLVAALYGCCHQRISQRKDQQRLTEELQTVENGYHDNPTLEVMETPSEMQEKKVVNLNGELGDSWIVPLDNLTKDDLDEEEDTHL